MHFSKHTLLYIFFILSLLILSIIGSQLSRFYGNSSLLSIMILLVGLIPILIAFEKIPQKFFPLLIFVVSLSLLYCTSLGTGYLWGADSHGEYYFADLVKTEGFWDSAIPKSYNAMLSITMLAPILSIISGLPLLLIFKIVYPVIFSFVPVILLIIFKTQFDDKISFLSVFFFISLFTFYTEMIGLARQQIAEVFVALILFVLLRKHVKIGERKLFLLLVFFGTGFVFSHYALVYIFIFCILFTLIASNILKRQITIRPLFLIYLISLSFSWYIYTSSSHIFDRFSSLMYNVSQSLISEFLNPGTVQPLHILVTSKVYPLHEVTRLLNILMVAVIVVGFAGVLTGIIKKKFSRDFLYLAGANFFLCLFAFASPYFASSLNTTRLYHISLMVLAPFAIIGFVLLIGLFFRVLKKRRSLSSKDSLPLKLVSIFLFVFLLFNTGFMYEISNTGSSILNPTWALSEGSQRERVSLFNSHVPPEEVASASWIKIHKESALHVYSDYRARNNALNAYALISRDEGSLLFLETLKISAGGFVYLRSLNIFDKLVEGYREETGTVQLYNASGITHALTQYANPIYSSCGSIIYYVPFSLSFDYSE